MPAVCSLLMLDLRAGESWWVSPGALIDDRLYPAMMFGPDVDICAGRVMRELLVSPHNAVARGFL